MVLPRIESCSDLDGLSTPMLRAGAALFARLGLRSLAVRLGLAAIIRECRAVEDEFAGERTEQPS
jgi:hypothetical protein